MTLPAWIASQLPTGSRDQMIACGGERMHVVEWGPAEGHAIRDVARAYRWPLRKFSDRAAPLALARMVPDSLQHRSIAALEKCEQVFRTAKVPVALVWGTKDPILGRAIGHVERLRPDAKVVRTNAGHFLQEEVPAELADAVLEVASRASWS